MNKRTAVLLVREGSKRLPSKALLPWQATTLLGWAVKQTLLCPSVGILVVGSDSDKLLLEARDAAAEIRRGLHLIMHKRAPVSDDQTSFDGLREVMFDGERRRDGETDHVLLTQCTSPFINPADLQRLCEFNPDPDGRACLSADDMGADNKRPSGMGYLINPAMPHTRQWFVPQRADPCDVDTLDDYRTALLKAPLQPVYGR